MCTSDCKSECGLADAPRTDDLDEPVVDEQPRDRSGLAVPTHELCRNGREVADANRGGLLGRYERCVVDEDLPLELLQLWPRFEAEFVSQAVPNALMSFQRVGLAARLVQGADQQHPQALLVGVARD